MPIHHHMSTEFATVIAITLLVLMGMLVYMILKLSSTKQKSKRWDEPVAVHTAVSSGWHDPYRAPAPTSGPYYSREDAPRSAPAYQPAPMQPVYNGNGSGYSSGGGNGLGMGMGGFAAGVLATELIDGGNRETIVEQPVVESRSQPDYSGSDDSGITWDSGSTVTSPSDTSPSDSGGYDSGSSSDSGGGADW